MPVRDSYAGDPAAGDVLTAANFKKLPGGCIGYVTASADVGPTSGTTPLTILSLASVAWDASRKLRLVFFASRLTGTVANDLFSVNLSLGGTQRAASLTQIIATSLQTAPVYVECLLDPGAASSGTLLIELVRSSGTGTATMKAGATAPMVAAAFDVGPAF